jgi:hypothetical protein
MMMVMRRRRKTLGMTAPPRRTVLAPPQFPSHVRLLPYHLFGRHRHPVSQVNMKKRKRDTEENLNTTRTKRKGGRFMGMMRVRTTPLDILYNYCVGNGIFH